MRLQPFIRSLAPVVLFVCFFLPAYAADDTVVEVHTAGGDVHQFQVELALDNASRQRGLMFRRDLAPDRGMLFVFPDVRHLSFWMKNTFIPLDIIFIKKNGQIANIVANAEPETLTGRHSKGRAVAVLEIPGGRSAELGIAAGDIVRHSLLGNAEPD